MIDQDPSPAELAAPDEPPKRVMNLPAFGSEPIVIDDIGVLLRERLSTDEIPWLDHSCRLIAYMAWPTDRKRRRLWMAAQIGTRVPASDVLAPHRTQPSDDGGSDTSRKLEAQDPSVSYFHRFGGHMDLAEFVSDNLHQELGRVQKTWGRVADIFQFHYDMAQGNHWKARGGASVG